MSEDTENEKTDDNAADADEAPESPKPAKKPAKAKKAAAAAPAPEPKAAAPEPKAASPEASGGGGLSTAAFVLGALGLIGGGVGGWIARGTQPGLPATPDPAAVVAPAGSSSAAAANGSGPICTQWVQGLCAGAGDKSEACGQAKTASALLTEEACQRALSDMPATLAKVKAARSSCDDLIAKICADIGKDTQTCKMVTETTARFPASQCREMLDNFDEIIPELRQMEKANAPLSAEVMAAQRAGEGPGFGPTSAKVAIVEYSDFECPYCTRAAGAVTELKKKYGDKVRFVFRQYPLPMHRNAQLAAEASLEAHAQGKFWELHDLMFANQRALDRDSLVKYAKEAGLDVAKFEKALDEHTHAEQVKADMKLGEQIGVNGTPTMVVGSARVQNPTDAAAIAAVIDEQLKAAGQ